MKLSIAALTVFWLFLALSCSGFPAKSGRLEELEREFGKRRAEGTKALSVRLHELVRKGLIPDMRKKNLEEAAAASSGNRAVASAAWWGWDEEESTDALNRAFSAPVDVLVVPAMARPWMVGPLFLKGPRVVLFEPGCVVMAAKNAFRGTGECLLSIVDAEGTHLVGYGTRLVMRKGDYSKKPYEKSQWRHAVSIRESAGILIEGFSIESSGGDGVYIGQRKGRRIPSDIILRDLDLKDHHRQGVSVIAASDLLMEYCRLIGTKGTPPQAGIDFEPNAGAYGFESCVVSNCVFRMNAGAAIHLHFINLHGSDPAVSILIKDTVLIGSPLAVWASGLSNGVRGALTFSGTIMEGVRAINATKDFQFVFR